MADDLDRKVSVARFRPTADDVPESCNSAKSSVPSHTGGRTISVAPVPGAEPGVAESLVIGRGIQSTLYVFSIGMMFPVQ